MHLFGGHGLWQVQLFGVFISCLERIVFVVIFFFFFFAWVFVLMLCVQSVVVEPGRTTFI